MAAFYLSEEHDEVIKEYVRYHEDALQQGAPQFHLVLLVNGEPATSMTVTIEGTLARFDDIGTEPKHQSMGMLHNLLITP